MTDTIATFTEKGILLESGTELEADIIVTATGLNLVALGQVELEVDGQPVDLHKTWTYKGMAYSDVPNLVSTFGYINASWTLRVDLNAAYLCRLLNHMRETGTTQCTPRSEADRPRHGAATLHRQLPSRLHQTRYAFTSSPRRPRTLAQHPELSERPQVHRPSASR